VSWEAQCRVLNDEGLAIVKAVPWDWG